MASSSSKTKSKDTNKTALWGQEYALSSSSSSTVEAVSNLFEEETTFEPNSGSGSGKTSQTPSEAVTEESEPSIGTKFKCVMAELKRIDITPGFFPVIKRFKLGAGIRQGFGRVRRKAASEPIRRSARYIDDSEPLMQSEKFGGHQFLGSDDPELQSSSGQNSNEDRSPQNSNEDRPQQNSNENQPQQNSNEDQPLQASNKEQPIPHRTLKQLYFDYSIYAANSIFIVPFLFLLFVLGCFTCYMGIQYFTQCELLNDIPILFVFMGVSSMAGLLSRIVYVLTKKRNFAKFEACRLGTLAAILTFGMCFAAESMYYIVRKGNPSAEQGPEYCDSFFYNYVYWYNWIALGIIIILIVVHGPNSCHYL